MLLSFVAIINEITAQEIKKGKKIFSSQISSGIVEGEQSTKLSY
jgi:hypothetical protein